MSTREHLKFIIQSRVSVHEQCSACIGNVGHMGGASGQRPDQEAIDCTKASEPSWRAAGRLRHGRVTGNLGARKVGIGTSPSSL